MILIADQEGQLNPRRQREMSDPVDGDTAIRQQQSEIDLAHSC